jgi:hypothetical protein
VLALDELTPLEADALAAALADAIELDAVHAAGLEAQLRQIREVIADRQRYIELLT